MAEILKLPSPAEKYDEMASKVALHSTIQATVSTAAEEKKEAGKPSSKAARLRGIKENRAHEREAIADEKAMKRPAEASKPPPKAPARDDAFGQRGSAVISILRNVKRK